MEFSASANYGPAQKYRLHSEHPAQRSGSEGLILDRLPVCMLISFDLGRPNLASSEEGYRDSDMLARAGSPRWDCSIVVEGICAVKSSLLVSTCDKNASGVKYLKCVPISRTDNRMSFRSAYWLTTQDARHVRLIEDFTIKGEIYLYLYFLCLSVCLFLWACPEINLLIDWLTDWLVY